MSIEPTTTTTAVRGPSGSFVPGKAELPEHSFSSSDFLAGSVSMFSWERLEQLLRLSEIMDDNEYVSGFRASRHGLAVRFGRVENGVEV